MNLVELLKRPEGKTLEFKRDLRPRRRAPSSRRWARRLTSEVAKAIDLISRATRTRLVPARRARTRA